MTTQDRVKLVVASKGKGNKLPALALAEETISRQGIADALGAARFAYEHRLEALRVDAEARECDLQQQYLAEVARIIEENE